MYARLVAQRPWYNPRHEGRVRRGDVIYATEKRARELIGRGLALRAPLPIDPPGPETTKPAGPSVTKPAGPSARKTARHTGGGWYEILDEDGQVLEKVRGKEARKEALR